VPRRTTTSHIKSLFFDHFCLVTAITKSKPFARPVSTQVFIVRPNSKIGTDVLRLDVMLPCKVGHQHRIIICVALISIPTFDRTTLTGRSNPRLTRMQTGVTVVRDGWKDPNLYGATPPPARAPRLCASLPPLQDRTRHTRRAPSAARLVPSSWPRGGRVPPRVDPVITIRRPADKVL
jgi:hypothetical protein